MTLKNKLTLDGLVVVEGRDDKALLEQVITDPIYVLHGYAGVSKDKLLELKELSKKYRIILILDPDFAGKKMREIIKKNINNIYEIFIPRQTATKKNNIGVENVSLQNIIKILEQHKVMKNNNKNNYLYTINDLVKNNLIGVPTSKDRREKLGDLLHIGYYNSKQLLKVLNSYQISYDEFNNALLKLNNGVGAIFGKFCPAHLGHINFIKKASKLVSKLIVFLCVEKIRDNNLLDKSTLPNKINEKDRYNILYNELKHFNNIQIIKLNEKNIEPYPNGWLNWSNRVNDKLKELNEHIDIIFTNEKQDIENYIKYFNCNVKYFDLDREQYSVSATKIRNDYSKYKNFLTEYAIKIIEGENGKSNIDG